MRFMFLYVWLDNLNYSEFRSWILYKTSLVIDFSALRVLLTCDGENSDISCNPLITDVVDVFRSVSFYVKMIHCHFKHRQMSYLAAVFIYMPV